MNQSTHTSILSNISAAGVFSDITEDISILSSSETLHAGSFEFRDWAAHITPQGLRAFRLSQPEFVDWSPPYDAHMINGRVSSGFAVVQYSWNACYILVVLMLLAADDNTIDGAAESPSPPPPLPRLVELGRVAVEREASCFSNIVAFCGAQNSSVNTSDYVCVIATHQPALLVMRISIPSPLQPSMTPSAVITMGHPFPMPIVPGMPLRQHPPAEGTSSEGHHWQTGSQLAKSRRRFSVQQGMGTASTAGQVRGAASDSVLDAMEGIKRSGTDDIIGEPIIHDEDSLSPPADIIIHIDEVSMELVMIVSTRSGHVHAVHAVPSPDESRSSLWQVDYRKRAPRAILHGTLPPTLFQLNNTHAAMAATSRTPMRLLIISDHVTMIQYKQATSTFYCSQRLALPRIARAVLLPVDNEPMLLVCDFQDAMHLFSLDPGGKQSRIKGHMMYLSHAGMCAFDHVASHESVPQIAAVSYQVNLRKRVNEKVSDDSNDIPAVSERGPADDNIVEATAMLTEDVNGGQRGDGNTARIAQDDGDVHRREDAMHIDRDPMQQDGNEVEHDGVDKKIVEGSHENHSVPEEAFETCNLMAIVDTSDGQVLATSNNQPMLLSEEEIFCLMVLPPTAFVYRPSNTGTSQPTEAPARQPLCYVIASIRRPLGESFDKLVLYACHAQHDDAKDVKSLPPGSFEIISELLMDSEIYEMCMLEHANLGSDPGQFCHRTLFVATAYNLVAYELPHPQYPRERGFLRKGKIPLNNGVISLTATELMPHPTYLRSSDRFQSSFVPLYVGPQDANRHFSATNNSSYRASWRDSDPTIKRIAMSHAVRNTRAVKGVFHPTHDADRVVGLVASSVDGTHVYAFYYPEVDADAWAVHPYSTSKMIGFHLVKTSRDVLTQSMSGVLLNNYYYFQCGISYRHTYQWAKTKAYLSGAITTTAAASTTAAATTAVQDPNNSIGTDRASIQWNSKRTIEFFELTPFKLKRFVVTTHSSHIINLYECVFDDMDSCNRSNGLIEDYSLRLVASFHQGSAHAKVLSGSVSSDLLLSYEALEQGLLHWDEDTSHAKEQEEAGMGEEKITQVAEDAQSIKNEIKKDHLPRQAARNHHKGIVYPSPKFAMAATCVASNGSVYEIFHSSCFLPWRHLPDWWVEFLWRIQRAVIAHPWVNPYGGERVYVRECASMIDDSSWRSVMDIYIPPAPGSIESDPDVGLDGNVNNSMDKTVAERSRQEERMVLENETTMKEGDVLNANTDTNNNNNDEAGGDRRTILRSSSKEEGKEEEFDCILHEYDLAARPKTVDNLFLDPDVFGRFFQLPQEIQRDIVSAANEDSLFMAGASDDERVAVVLYEVSKWLHPR